ncbi:hypothetical protein BpHYR1_020139 [Brachionus plicatilis]|uniref:Uncharacterized protein n=1 Tax=Brachionus plicatilis TaxID=10195 RepID=A0A3M7RDT0_BRAPC|nr:hypothetical protein BpHYR1_020139 [Brachionus plicatilis]
MVPLRIILVLKEPKFWKKIVHFGFKTVPNFKTKCFEIFSIIKSTTKNILVQSYTFFDHLHLYFNICSYLTPDTRLVKSIDPISVISLEFDPKLFNHVKASALAKLKLGTEKTNK